MLVTNIISQRPKIYNDLPKIYLGEIATATRISRFRH